MKKIGLVVNPIAGMGGRVGLKGTDGKDILKKAIELGSVPEAPAKAELALEKLLPIKDEIELLVASGDMGENEAKNVGLNYRVVYQAGEETDEKDTAALSDILEKEEVELVLFVGGDGTARDIYNAIETRVPAIGIPAGVKIHSPVYGNTPESAGELAYLYLSGASLDLRDEEVVDLDEDAFREDRVEVALHGFLKVPYDETYLQGQKSQTPQADHDAQISIALEIIDDMEDDVYYIIGSGTTPMHILQELGLDYTVLGVDIVLNKELFAKDVNENQILDILKDGDKPAKLIVTPMGGQGYLFGRGNQQLSANVLRKIGKDNITIVATQGKLNSLGDRDMLIYTMDKEMDEALTGYYKVIIGYGRYMVMRASDRSDR